MCHAYFQQEAAAKLVPVSDVTVSHVSPAEEDLTYDDVKNHNLIVCTQESPSGSNDILNLNDQECRKFSRRARTNTLETVWEQSGNYSGVVDEQLGNISDVDAFHKFLRDNRICESIHDSGIGDSSNRSSALFNDVDETGSSEIFDEFVEEKDEKLIEAEWSVSSALRKLLSTNPSHWMDLELKRGKSHKRRWSCSEFKKDWGQIVLKKVLFADAKCETSTPHWVLEELLDLWGIDMILTLGKLNLFFETWKYICIFQKLDLEQAVEVIVCGRQGPGERFKNAYELLTLRALKISYVS